MMIRTDIDLYEEDRDMIEKFFGTSYRPFAGEYPCEPYCVILRKPKKETSKDERTDGFKKFLSCIFSYGTFRNKIETLPVKRIYHIALVTFAIISLLAISIGVYAGTATGKAPMGCVAFILVFSFGYASIQMLNLCADRIVVLCETDLEEEFVLWPTKNIDNVTKLNTFDELYPLKLTWVERKLPFIFPLFRGIIHFPLIKRMATAKTYKPENTPISIENLNYLFSMRDEGEIFLLYGRRVYKFEQ